MSCYNCDCETLLNSFNDEDETSYFNEEDLRAFECFYGGDPPAPNNVRTNKEIDENL